jgi:hypothetical protein
LSIVASDNPGEAYVDVNFNAQQDVDEPFAHYGPDGLGNFVIAATIPNSGDRVTMPFATTVSCNAQNLFIAAEEGSHVITIDAESVDPGPGALQFHSDSLRLVIGAVTPAPQCGDPLVVVTRTSDIATDATPGVAASSRAAAITASDALFILKTAVGLETCLACVCDVDGGGTVTASDALIALRVAVGQAIPLSCLSCA